MKRILLAFFVALLAGPALAQGTIQQSGPVVFGHAPAWFGNGIQGDSGPASGGNSYGLSEILGIERGTGQAPFANAGSGPLNADWCNYDGPTTGPNHYLCLSPNAQGGGLIAYGAQNGATPGDLFFNINGTAYGFPGPGNGNVDGPTTTTVGHLAIWNSTTGTLLKDLADLPIANGGTGATDAATALSNLGGAPLISPTFTGTVTMPSGVFNSAGSTLSGTINLPDGIYNPEASGGLFLTGAIGSYSPFVARTDAVIEVQNTASHPGHALVSLVNTVPGIGSSLSPEAAVAFSQAFSSGIGETAAIFQGFAETGQQSGTINNNATSAYSYLGIHTIGGAGSDKANVVYYSNNSGYQNANNSSATPWYYGPPADNWLDNFGSQLIESALIVGTQQSYNYTATNGTNTLTAVSPNPTTSGLVVGEYLRGSCLPNHAIVTSMNSTSITFSGGVSVCGITAQLSVLPYAAESGFAIEGTGFGRFASSYAGPGAELGYNTNTSVGFLQAYNRTTAAPVPLTIGGSTLEVDTGTSLVKALAISLQGVTTLTPTGGDGLVIARVAGNSSIAGVTDLAIDGSDTTGTLFIQTLGTGNVEFGASSFTANGAVATTLTSLGPSGAHTTVQEWFTLKDAAGTLRYIPAY